MKEIFETYIDNAFGEYKQEEDKFREFEYNYKQYFPSDKNAAILDIGVGRGEMLTCMQNWSYQNYLGIDISPSTISFCKSLGLHCELVEETSEWLRAQRGKFELITLLDVLEHVRRDATISFLRAIYDALTPLGQVIIQVPNLQSPDGQLHMYNDITHEVGYIEHSLQQVLVCSGFKNITFYGFETITESSFYTKRRRLKRELYWKTVRYFRQVTGNINPSILHPVFFAVAKK